MIWPGVLGTAESEQEQFYFKNTEQTPIINYLSNKKHIKSDLIYRTKN